MIKDQDLEDTHQKMNNEYKYSTNDHDKEIKWIQVNPYQRIIHNDTTLIVSNNKSLKFYSMFSTNRKIRILNIIQGRYGIETVCYFFSKSNDFITLGITGSVRLWYQNQLYNWVPKSRIIYLDYDRIEVVVVNQQENTIVTGAFNKISFWDRSLDWKCSQTIKLEYDRVACLSLSENDNRLISVGYQYEISIFHNIQNMGWQLLQRINEQRGYQLCFITKDLFVFKTSYEESLIFYEFNNNAEMFLKQKQIKIPKENTNLSFNYITNEQHKYDFQIYQIGNQIQFSIDYDKQLQQRLNIPSIKFKSSSFISVSGLKQNILLQWFKGKNVIGSLNLLTQNYVD